jgi:hypothetical protein
MPKIKRKKYDLKRWPSGSRCESVYVRSGSREQRIDYPVGAVCPAGRGYAFIAVGTKSSDSVSGLRRNKGQAVAQVLSNWRRWARRGKR